MASLPDKSAELELALEHLSDRHLQVAPPADRLLAQGLVVMRHLVVARSAAFAFRLAFVLEAARFVPLMFVTDRAEVAAVDSGEAVDQVSFSSVFAFSERGLPNQVFGCQRWWA